MNEILEGSSITRYSVSAVFWHLWCLCALKFFLRVDRFVGHIPQQAALVEDKNTFTGTPDRCDSALFVCS
jgi:hypothetical protein